MFHKEGSKIIFITLLVSVGLIFLADALVKDNLWLLKSIQIGVLIFILLI
jgi:phosphatidylserine decarboxylase